MRMKYSGSNDGTGLITRKLGPYELELRARRGPHLPTTAMPDPEAEDELALRFYTACFDGSLGEVKDIVQSEEASCAQGPSRDGTDAPPRPVQRPHPRVHARSNARPDRILFQQNRSCHSRQ